MIEAKVNLRERENNVSVKIRGTKEELADDVGEVIHACYNIIKGQNPEDAAKFKTIIQGIVADDGTAWTPPAELMKEG